MANKTVTAASVLFSSGAKFLDGIAGEAMAIMQPVYLDQSVTPNVYRLADANASLAASRVVGVVASPAAAANQPIRVCWYDPLLTTGFDSLAAGDIIILSATAGASCPAADLASGSYPAILGVGISATQMIFNPGQLNGTAAKP